MELMPGKNIAIRVPLYKRLKIVEFYKNRLRLSWPKLERAMAGPEVTAALHRTKALAQRFGFIGTPALVVGRTVVEGGIPEDRLRELVHYERG